MIVQQLQEFAKRLEHVVSKEKLFIDLKTLAETHLMPVDRLAGLLPPYIVIVTKIFVIFR